MGLHVHSLENIPQSQDRDYMIYLLEYGWHEPLSKTLNENFNQMASRAPNSSNALGSKEHSSKKERNHENLQYS